MSTTEQGTATRNRTGRLAGKVALITGAGGNFGETIVRRYLEEGARVVMVGRKRAKLEATLARVEQALGWGSREAMILPFDASDPGQARLGIQQGKQLASADDGTQHIAHIRGAAVCLAWAAVKQRQLADPTARMQDIDGEGAAFGQARFHEHSASEDEHHEVGIVLLFFDQKALARRDGVAEAGGFGMQVACDQAHVGILKGTGVRCCESRGRSPGARCGRAG